MEADGIFSLGTCAQVDTQVDTGRQKQMNEENEKEAEKREKFEFICKWKERDVFKKI
ncbi:hypothetical protein P0082_05750 [Candidatus Haliotispira prima]|uniref:Uncharacterized protein n=1 Tax=Candidatus Haliotispira prima TaxID=3034016 RepID=A0ABY8MK01_9SPIO|nr:hypothetical protein P0082_05750 [Candidatus Haliotispira prima]